MIAREGYLIVAVAFVLAFILGLIGMRMGTIGQVLFGGVAVLLLAFTLYFFRDRLRGQCGCCEA